MPRTRLVPSNETVARRRCRDRSPLRVLMARDYARLLHRGLQACFSFLGAYVNKPARVPPANKLRKSRGNVSHACLSGTTNLYCRELASRLAAHLAASVFIGSTLSHFRHTSLVRPVRSVSAINRFLHSRQRVKSMFAPVLMTACNRNLVRSSPCLTAASQRADTQPFADSSRYLNCRHIN